MDSLTYPWTHLLLNPSNIEKEECEDDENKNLRSKPTTINISSFNP